MNCEPVMSFAPISRKITRTLLVGTIFFGCLSAQSAAPAKAEGFPGVGSRMAYADALPHYNLGNRYMAREWWEKAVEKYNDAIDIYPYDPDVYINLGTALRKMQDNAGAERAFRKALELNDKDWITWSNLGNMIMMQDRFMEALECFEKAFKCGAPEADKKAMEENIDGIKKILKNKHGIDLDAIAAQKAAKEKAEATRAAKAGKGKGTSTAKAGAVSAKSGVAAKPASGPEPGSAAKAASSAKKSIAVNVKSDSSKPNDATVSGAARKDAKRSLADALPKSADDGSAQAQTPGVSTNTVGAPVKETETGYEIWIDGSSNDMTEDQEQE